MKNNQNGAGMLHSWMKHSFQKLGWMVIAKENGNLLQVEAYKDSLKRLEGKISEKLEKVKDSDKKGDLKEMLTYVKILRKFVKKNI